MRSLVIIFTILMLIPAWSYCDAQGDLSSDEDLPPYLRDRGAGIPTSMFGTYVMPGELLVYPFFEYYLDHDAEYSPQELGYGLDRDYRSEYEAFEGLIFLGYGLTSDISVEMEAAVISADLDKSPEDPTDVPDEINESGLGDVQTQINWRCLRETEHRPALFSYFEVVYPLQKDKVLIGTSDWEFKLGTGVIRGFGWGTMTLRVAVECDRSEDKFEIGELAVGLTSKATDWAPETGVVFRF